MKKDKDQADTYMKMDKSPLNVRQTPLGHLVFADSGVKKGNTEEQSLLSRCLENMYSNKSNLGKELMRLESLLVALRGPDINKEPMPPAEDVSMTGGKMEEIDMVTHETGMQIAGLREMINELNKIVN